MRTVLLLLLSPLLINVALHGKPKPAIADSSNQLPFEIVQGGIRHHAEAQEREEEAELVRESTSGEKTQRNVVSQKSNGKQIIARKKIRPHRKLGKRVGKQDREILGGMMLALGLVGVLASGLFALARAFVGTSGSTALAASLLTFTLIGFFVGLALIAIGITLLTNSK